VLEVAGATLYGVFDGHGENGHLIAEYVNQGLPRSVLRHRQRTATELSARLPACFARMQGAVLSQQRLGSKYSGTTATVVLHDHDQHTITMAHVGDSSAVLVRSKPKDATEVEAILLTREHDPSLPDEKRRIERAGARVINDDGFNRVFMRNGSGPGLNMSRSLGDEIGHRACGLSAQPEVSSRHLQACDHILLVCSDGIWTVMSPQEAANVVKSYRSDQADAAAQNLVDKARSLWMRGTRGTKADDITATVVFLHREGPAILDSVSTAEPSSPCPSIMSPQVDLPRGVGDSA